MCLNAELNPICACETEEKMTTQTCIDDAMTSRLDNVWNHSIGQSPKAKRFSIKVLDGTIDFIFRVLFL